MKREGIVDLRSDPLLFQPGLQTVALDAADDELVVDMPRLPGSWFRQHDRKREAGQALAVSPGVLLAARRPLIEVAELHPQNGRLQCIEPGIDSYPLVVVFARAAVDAQGR